MLIIVKKSVLPGFGIAFGSNLLFFCLIFLLPLSMLVIQLSYMTWIQYWEVVTDPIIVASYKITLMSAGIATLFNSFFGILISWILTRYDFLGRKLLDSLIDLPFALPTAVAGLTLATLFSTSGWYGSLLSNWNITVSYTWMGISVAMIFTSIPFVVRSIQPILENFNLDCEESAKVLGANRWQIFYHIIFPEIIPAWLSGTMLCFIRSLGEFGAVIFIAGNIAWKSEVISLIIFIKIQEFDYPAASAVSSIILTIALLLLFINNMLQARLERRLK